MTSRDSPTSRFGALTLVTGLLGVMVVLLGGCSSTYDSRFSYEPRPAVVTQDAGVRTLVSVLGLLRPDEAEGRAAAVDVRVRVEASGSDIVQLDPGTMTLLSADLKEFEQVRATPPTAVTVAPGDSTTFVAQFPVPDRDQGDSLDLSRLHLSWDLTIGSTTLQQDVTVSRATMPRYSGSHWSFGYGHCRHGRAWHRCGWCW